MAITTQIADKVVELINGQQPYAVPFDAIRKPVAHYQREDIEEMQVTVVAGVRSSLRASRNQFERRYPIQIVIDYAVNTDDNAQADGEHEVVEEIGNVLEKNYSITLDNNRRFVMEVIEEDADESGLTDSQHLLIVLVAQYREFYG